MTIVGARDLRNADFSLPWQNNLSDPYCICEIEGKPLSRTMTDVVRDNLSPVWNHEARFADFQEGDVFAFSLWDRDQHKLKRDDFLGRARLGSGRFFPAGFDQEILLEEAGKNRMAYLKIKIPPAQREKLQKAASGSSTRPKRWTYRKSARSGNKNRPSDYVWLQDALESLTANDAASLQVRDLDQKKSLTSTLFVVGGCPNALCGMQAVMFAVDAANALDFWWVKPSKSAPSQLEKETLNRHSSGKHKNDPGRSKPFYQPLADLFTHGSLVGDWRFGLERASHAGKSLTRCVIRNEAEGKANVYLQLLWQEDWTSNPFASSKFIKGKLVYQRKLGDVESWHRQYEIYDGKAQIAMCEEGPFRSSLPSDDVKDLWDMSELIPV